MIDDSLDPADWESFAQLGHHMLDDLLQMLRTVRERPVWRKPPKDALAALREGLPRRPQGAEKVYDDIRRWILPNPLGNIHPRFWGWVIGTGTPLGMLADMLAAGMNSSLSGFDQVALRVEEQVLDWLKEVMGFPPKAGGVLLSGGSMANIVGLKVARDAQAGYDLRREGVKGPPLRIYASREVHSSVIKAVEMLGLGRQALRLIDADDSFRIDVAKLEQAVRDDRIRGLRPICVVGTAGTVNSGACDDFHALADFCRQQDLWLHVDGAFGALARFSPQLRERLAGMERADSLGFDLHKWLSQPSDVASLLVRRPGVLETAFSVDADYLKAVPGGLMRIPSIMSDRGPQLTRSFRALKLWMALKAEGTDKFGRIIRRNVEQAAYLGELVERHPQLELLAPVALNVVCFRFAPQGVPQRELDSLNEAIMVGLQEEGIAVLSSTLIGGRFSLRMANVNHRSMRADFELLVKEIARIGREQMEKRLQRH
ncbi:MAG TPA: pyridoxal-dependent decarboxylase [Acidobacteriota bacterium]|nr:pyridoxal-dependent decarboxylase [Acidobacteriota bacterium]